MAESLVPVNRATTLLDSECPCCGNRLRITEHERGAYGCRSRTLDAVEGVASVALNMEFPARSVEVSWGTFVRRPAHVVTKVVRNHEGRLMGSVVDTDYLPAS